ncbi:LmbU family transcriptional regulator [Actinospica sp. MGRD01-02]|uniref:LmbU family transcriptional regulator n=1 Tax=Actinospica acidithermotolerans TaxID=2828514 RepID=A0A941EEP6_9ACTN|nr:LmbU family transcriptional regulator [Actinospica acidithermotolerans]MBR7826384.1 LmbU family transcriptional regulator [Actinospica acidithermotolerans]
MTLTTTQAATLVVRAADGEPGADTSPTGREGERVNALKRLRAATQRTALRLPSGLGMPDWVNLGRQLFVVADSSAWWLGDWLIYGESHFPDRYELMLAETNLDYQTLRNYAWVARKYLPEQRRERLSFQHHAETASLPEPERGHWLERAEAGRWSRNELRRRLREDRAALRTRADVLFTLNVLRERQERWQRAAQSAQLQLDEWIVQILDRAATPAVP